MPIANWIYFILTAQFIWAFTSLIDKIVISKGYIRNPFVYIVLNGAMNVLIIFLLPFAGFEPLSALDFLIVLFSAVVFHAGVIVYYKAVEHDEISRIVMLFQLIPVFVFMLSFLFLGEVLAKNHLIGFAFLLLAGFLVSYKKEKKAFRLSTAFYLMIIATFLIAIGYVSQKYAFTITGFWSAFLWIRLASFSSLAVLLVPSIKNDFAATFRSMPNKIILLLVLKMVIDFSAFIFLGLALLNGPVSLVSALGNSIEPLFIFLIALAFSVYFPYIIKESIDRKTITTKLLAIVFILIGVVFVNL